jgi:hypothetical protein
MEYVARLFGEAWQRRQQRHRILALGVSLVLSAIAVVVLALASNSSTSTIGGGYQPEQPSRVLAAHHVALFSGTGLEGVHANVAVLLKRPAESVVASLDGRQERLQSVRWKVAPYRGAPPVTWKNLRQRDVGFRGDLQPALLRRYSSLESRGLFPRTLIVTLHINYRIGPAVSTSFSAHFSAH